MLTETIDFQSKEFTEAVTEYFGDCGNEDDSDEWTSDNEEETVVENGTAVDEAEGESLFTFDSMLKFYLIFDTVRNDNDFQ